MKTRLLLFALCFLAFRLLRAQEAVTLPEIDVLARLDAARNRILPDLGATSYEIPEAQLQGQSQGENAPFNQVLLRAPGVAQDSFGQLHLRGEHANIQYRINDVLLPEGITGFGAELDSRFVGGVSLVDGALPAQYGFKTAGVISIQTKKAQGGEAGLYGGSFDTLRPAIQYGGSSGKLDYYFTASFFHSALGIENPTPRTNAIHDDTNQYRGFFYVSYLIDASSRISLFGGASYSDYQIPNNPGQKPQFTFHNVSTFDSSKLNENQHQNNDYAVLAYQKTMGPFDCQAALFERYSGVLFTPDYKGDLIFNGLAGRVDRRLLTHGAEFDASFSLNEQHTLRGGFTAAMSQQRANDPFSVFPDGSTDPVHIEQGDYRDGWVYGFYLQDEWKVWAPLTINFGTRFDVVDEFTHENQLSPRINLTLRIARGTVFHTGYARYFTPPSFEAVTPRDVAATAGTSGAFEALRDDPVRAERSDYFDAGISQAVAPGLQVGLDGYYKRAHNQIDSGQFGAAVIETEFNYREGQVFGVELTSTYKREGFSAYGNAALSKALGRDIDSQQFQFGADELAYIKTHWIYLDHNQAVTASAGVSYTWRETRAYVDLLYGNGLREGFANLGKERPYYPVNIGFEPKIGPLKLRFDIVNLFDESYQLRSGTGVGVGAPQFGARRGFYAGVVLDF